MVTDVPENGDGRPADELGPGLRRAVESILNDPPAEGLGRKVLEDLRGRRPRAARFRSRRLALVGALVAAACVAAVVVVVQSRDGGSQPGRSGLPVPCLAEAEDLPTLWAYHRASQISPEALDRLLDEHARRILLPSSEPFSFRGVVGVGRHTL